MIHCEKGAYCANGFCSCGCNDCHQATKLRSEKGKVRMTIFLNGHAYGADIGWDPHGSELCIHCKLIRKLADSVVCPGI